MFIQLVDADNNTFLINSNDIDVVYEIKAENLDEYLTLYNKCGGAKWHIRTKIGKDYYTKSDIRTILNSINELESSK